MGYTFQDYANAYKENTQVFKPKPFSPPPNPSDFYAKPNPSDFYAKPNPVAGPLQPVPKPSNPVAPKPFNPGNLKPKLPGAGGFAGFFGAVVQELIFPDPVEDGTLPKNPLAPISPNPDPYDPTDGTGLGQQYCKDYRVTVGYQNFPSAPSEHQLPGPVSLQLNTNSEGVGTYSLVSGCPGNGSINVLGGLNVGQPGEPRAYILNIETMDGSPDVGAPPTSTPEKMPDVPVFIEGLDLTELDSVFDPDGLSAGKLSKAKNKPAALAKPKDTNTIPALAPNQLPGSGLNPSALEKIKTKKGSEIDKYKPGGELDKVTPGGELDKTTPGGDLDKTTPGGKLKLGPTDISPGVGGPPGDPPGTPPPTPPSKPLKDIKDALGKLPIGGVGGMSCDELKECLGIGDSATNPLLEAVELIYTICTEDEETKEHKAEKKLKKFQTPKGQFTDEDKLKFVKSADLAKEGCEDDIAYAIVPDAWMIRSSGEVPQLAVKLREIKPDGKLGKEYRSFHIPHYNKPKSFKPSFPDFTKGQFYARLLLKDNSKLVIYAESINEAIKVVNACVPYIDSAFLYSPLKIYTGERKGVKLPVFKVKAIHCLFYSEGQKELQPDWERIL